jgi:hypothetical protein
MADTGLVAIFQRMASASTTITSFGGATGNAAAGITAMSTVAETMTAGIVTAGESVAAAGTGMATAGTGAAGMAAGLASIAGPALAVVGVIAAVAAAAYGLYRLFKTNDGAMMWRRMHEGAMQCRAAVEPFIQRLGGAISHLAGTIRGVLGKAWQENRGWILMLADAWVKVGMAQWTVVIRAVSTAFTGVVRVVDWLIGGIGRLIGLMKYLPQVAALRAAGDAYWKNSGGLPSGRGGGLTTVSTKTPSKKPDGKNENAAIFTAIQKGESVENHKTSTPKHTSTGGIPTSSYRVPSSTAPQYKTPPPTADEKAEQRMGQWETAINAKKAGVALPKDSSWMAGFDVTQWISKLSKIAGGIGEFAKTSVATRLKAKQAINNINDEAADEYNQSLEKQASALDEQHARGILSDKEYFEKYAALLIEATNNTKASAQTKNTLTDKATSIRISQLDAEYKAGKITQEEYIKGLQEIVDRRGIYANAEVSLVQGAQSKITQIIQENIEKQKQDMEAAYDLKLMEIWRPNGVSLWMVPASSAWVGCMAA